MAAPPGQLLADAKATDEFMKSHVFGTAAGAAGRLREAMAYAVMNGGKRVRASLVLGAARLASESGDVESALRVAAAFECFHSYSLIHDDLPAMDDAETRRGRKSCHIEFDEATAILAGDALQSLAFELLSDPLAHPDPGVRAGLVLDLAQAAGAGGMAGGQMLDLEAETRRSNRSQTDVVQLMKTGALIRSAARCGGAIGGAGSRLIEGLDAYARNLGLAFQIADDILDYSADSEALGKPAGRDRKAGKASYVQLMGLEQAQAEAEKLVATAGAALKEAAAAPSPHLDYLLELASFSIKRGH